MTMSEYRVIIADGNAQFRHTTAEFFRTDKEIIRVEEATDGQAALEKMREEHFDVLITGIGNAETGRAGSFGSASY